MKNPEHKQKAQKPPTNELTEDQLDKVAGGTQISPSYHGPKLHAPASIAQGEINSNSTDSNLPDSGGDGIIR